MHFTKLVSSAALLLLAGADMASAKAILHLPNTVRRRDYRSDLAKDAARILRREPQGTSQGMTVAPQTDAVNASIADACASGLRQITEVENDAGLTACYNIMQYDAAQGAFEADLRLYKAFEPSGDFEDVAINDIMVTVTFPASTMFQSLTKRKRRDLGARQDSMSEIQQYSLFGTFQKDLDLSLLNDTQIMSLMLPNIQLNAIDVDQQPVTANLTAGDGAWFVIGQFTGDFSETDITPSVAAAAIAIASPFVLPGVTLGIFPTGLIITGSWTGLFLVAYGLGTLGRIRHRRVFRARKAATAGRTGKKM